MTDWLRLIWLGRVQHWVELPFSYPMALTLGQLQAQKRTLLVFFGSLAWLSVLVTYMIVWLTKSGCLLGVSPTAMGLTFGAIGTSVRFLWFFGFLWVPPWP